MISKDEKLRKISDNIFQEAEPPKDRKKPLEWRRSFNFVRLPLKNIKIINSCTVHDTKFSLGEKTENPVDQIIPDISSKIVITGDLDEDRARDSIYFAVKNKDEERIFSLERARGGTRISLRSGVPSKSDNIPDGLYWGNAFRTDYEPNEDDLCFELSVPEEQINFLVAALRADDNSTIEAGVHLLSFTYEVDSFFREYYHPQDIVIEDSTLCFVAWAAVTSRVGQHYITSDSASEDDIELHQEGVPFEQRSHQDLLKVLLSYSKPLNSIVKALWVLIIVIVLYAIST